MKNSRIAIWVVAFLLLLTLPSMAQDDRTDRGDAGSEDSLVTRFLAVTAANADQLAEAMDIPATDLVSASIGSSSPAGVGIGDEPLNVFPTFGNTFTILSTGRAEDADNPDTNNSEVYMGEGYLDDVSTSLGGLNNSSGFDLVQLTLVLTPPVGSSALNFDFAFFSEEFPDYVNFKFNDAFLAELGAEPYSSEILISGASIASPGNIALDPNGDVLSVNAAFGFNPSVPNPDTGTTYDGTSGLLSATACLPEDLPTGNVVLIFSITDMGDTLLDSAVFLDNFTWSTPSECTSVVTPKTGTLNVLKVVNENGVQIDPNQTFEVCVSGPSYPNGTCFTYGAAGGEKILSNLLPGPYTISETDPGPAWLVDLPIPVTVMPGLTETAIVTNTAINLNQPPNAAPDNATTDKDVPVTISVLANDSDPDGDAFSLISAGSAPNGTVSTNPDGTITYTPNGGYTGSDVFTYMIMDEHGATASASVYITINDLVVEPECIDPNPARDLKHSGSYIHADNVTGTIQNLSDACSYNVGMASYQMPNNVIDNQVLFSSQLATIGPNQTINLSISLPGCAAQVDLFYGPLLNNLNGQRYGDRLIDGRFVDWGNWCDLGAG